MNKKRRELSIVDAFCVGILVSIINILIYLGYYDQMEKFIFSFVVLCYIFIFIPSILKAFFEIINKE